MSKRTGPPDRDPTLSQHHNSLFEAAFPAEARVQAAAAVGKYVVTRGGRGIEAGDEAADIPDEVFDAYKYLSAALGRLNSGPPTGSIDDEDEGGDGALEDGRSHQDDTVSEDEGEDGGARLDNADTNVGKDLEIADSGSATAAYRVIEQIRNRKRMEDKAASTQSRFLSPALPLDPSMLKRTKMQYPMAIKPWGPGDKNWRAHVVGPQSQEPKRPVLMRGEPSPSLMQGGHPRPNVASVGFNPWAHIERWKHAALLTGDGPLPPVGMLWRCIGNRWTGSGLRVSQRTRLKLPLETEKERSEIALPCLYHNPDGWVENPPGGVEGNKERGLIKHVWFPTSIIQVTRGAILARYHRKETATAADIMYPIVVKVNTRSGIIAHLNRPFFDNGNGAWWGQESDSMSNPDYADVAEHNDRRFRNENKILELLDMTGSSHFKRLYGPPMHPDSLVVTDNIPDRSLDKNPPHSLLGLWRLAECLYKAIAVLNCGSENIDHPIPAWTPIVLLDVSPQTIMIHENDHCHSCGTYRCYKVCALDLAFEWDPKARGAENQREIEIETGRLSQLGRGEFRCPEQTRICKRLQVPPIARAAADTLPNYGFATNLYWMGTVLRNGAPENVSRQLMANRDHPEGAKILREFSNRVTPQRGATTVAAYRMFALINRLRETDPGQRPTLFELRKEIQYGLAEADDVGDHLAGHPEQWEEELWSRRLVQNIIIRNTDAGGGAWDMQDGNSIRAPGPGRIGDNIPDEPTILDDGDAEHDGTGDHPAMGSTVEPDGHDTGPPSVQGHEQWTTNISTQRHDSRGSHHVVIQQLGGQSTGGQTSGGQHQETQHTGGQYTGGQQHTSSRLTVSRHTSSQDTVSQPTGVQVTGTQGAGEWTTHSIPIHNRLKTVQLGRTKVPETPIPQSNVPYITPETESQNHITEAINRTGAPLMQGASDQVMQETPTSPLPSTGHVMGERVRTSSAVFDPPLAFQQQPTGQQAGDGTAFVPISGHTTISGDSNSHQTRSGFTAENVYQTGGRQGRQPTGSAKGGSSQSRQQSTTSRSSSIHTTQTGYTGDNVYQGGGGGQGGQPADFGRGVSSQSPQQSTTDSASSIHTPQIGYNTGDNAHQGSGGNQGVQHSSSQQESIRSRQQSITDSTCSVHTTPTGYTTVNLYQDGGTQGGGIQGGQDEGGAPGQDSCHGHQFGGSDVHWVFPPRPAPDSQGLHPGPLVPLGGDAAFISRAGSPVSTISFTEKCPTNCTNNLHPHAVPKPFTKRTVSGTYVENITHGNGKYVRTWEQYPHGSPGPTSTPGPGPDPPGPRNPSASHPSHGRAPSGFRETPAEAPNSTPGPVENIRTPNPRSVHVTSGLGSVSSGVSASVGATSDEIGSTTISQRSAVRSPSRSVPARVPGSTTPSKGSGLQTVILQNPGSRTPARPPNPPSANPLAPNVSGGIRKPSAAGTPSRASPLKQGGSVARLGSPRKPSASPGARGSSTPTRNRSTVIQVPSSSETSEEDRMDIDPVSPTGSDSGSDEQIANRLEIARALGDKVRADLEETIRLDQEAAAAGDSRVAPAVSQIPPPQLPTQEQVHHKIQERVHEWEMRKRREAEREQVEHMRREEEEAERRRQDQEAKERQEVARRQEEDKARQRREVEERKKREEEERKKRQEAVRARLQQQRKEKEEAAVATIQTATAANASTGTGSTRTVSLAQYEVDRNEQRQRDTAAAEARAEAAAEESRRLEAEQKMKRLREKWGTKKLLAEQAKNNLLQGQERIVKRSTGVQIKLKEDSERVYKQEQEAKAKQEAEVRAREKQEVVDRASAATAEASKKRAEEASKRRAEEASRTPKTTRTVSMISSTQHNVQNTITTTTEGVQPTPSAATSTGGLPNQRQTPVSTPAVAATPIVPSSRPKIPAQSLAKACHEYISHDREVWREEFAFNHGGRPCSGQTYDQWDNMINLAERLWVAEHFLIAWNTLGPQWDVEISSGLREDYPADMRSSDRFEHQNQEATLGTETRARERIRLDHEAKEGRARERNPFDDDGKHGDEDLISGDALRLWMELPGRKVEFERIRQLRDMPREQDSLWRDIQRTVPGGWDPDCLSDEDESSGDDDSDDNDGSRGGMFVGGGGPGGPDPIARGRFAGLKSRPTDMHSGSSSRGATPSRSVSRSRGMSHAPSNTRSASNASARSMCPYLSGQSEAGDEDDMDVDMEDAADRVPGWARGREEDVDDLVLDEHELRSALAGRSGVRSKKRPSAAIMGEALGPAASAGVRKGSSSGSVSPVKKGTVGVKRVGSSQQQSPVRKPQGGRAVSAGPGRTGTPSIKPTGAAAARSQSKAGRSKDVVEDVGARDSIDINMSMDVDDPFVDSTTTAATTTTPSRGRQARSGSKKASIKAGKRAVTPAAAAGRMQQEEPSTPTKRTPGRPRGKTVTPSAAAAGRVEQEKETAMPARKTPGGPGGKIATPVTEKEDANQEAEVTGRLTRSRSRRNLKK